MQDKTNQELTQDLNQLFALYESVMSRLDAQSKRIEKLENALETVTRRSDPDYKGNYNVPD